MIRFTVERTDVVSDGRHYTSAEGYSGSSMFEYRIEDAGTDDRALWWVDAAEAGAGAVKVACHR